VDYKVRIEKALEAQDTGLHELPTPFPDVMLSKSSPLAFACI